MSQREHPTIPEIVRALTTLNDRHTDEKQAIRDEYCEANLRDREARERAEWIIDRRDTEIEFLRDLIGDLCRRIERAQQQLRRDNRMCAYTDPLDILELLGRETEPNAVIRRARDKRRADERRKVPNRVVRCDCGDTWARPGEAMEEGHSEQWCQLPPCPTQFDAGPCAGTKGHPGDCTPNADDIPSTQEADPADTDLGICRYACTHKVVDHGPDGCTHRRCPCKATHIQPTPEPKCRICGHDEERHTTTLPEEGADEYCAECGGGDEYHAFDGSEPHEDDVCACGCTRRRHQGDEGLGGAQCRVCPGDDERSWRHAFLMKTKAGV